MSKIEKLTPLIKKQADLAIARLLDNPPMNKQLVATYKGLRILIQEEMPHPSKQASIRLPIALLDYKTDGWLLLFRGFQGEWQVLPEDQPCHRIEDKITLIQTDPFGVFFN